MVDTRVVARGQVDFGKVIETTPARLFVFDGAGACLFVNGDAARLLGLAPEDVVDRSLGELAVRHELLHAIVVPLERVVASAGPVSGEARVSTPDGGRGVLHYDLRPLELHDGVVETVLCTVTDITDLRSAQESERRVRRQLHDALTRVLRGFVRVCSECYAISLEGEWVPLDRYLERSDAARVSHGYCDACYQRALAELEPGD